MTKGENVANVTLGTSSGTGLILAINEYATVISLSLTAIGIIAGIVFHVLALIDRRKQIKMNLIKAKHEEITKTKIIKEQ